MGQPVKDYNKALKLARKGDYLTARKLLLPYKDDDAVKLLKRINMEILKERNEEAKIEEQRTRKHTLFDPRNNISTGKKVGYVILTLLFLRFMARLFLGG